MWNTVELEKMKRSGRWNVNGIMSMRKCICRIQWEWKVEW